MMREITRRDFLNGALITAGGLLTMRGVSAAANEESLPDWARLMVGNDWYGYGGVGDFASSHGNTPTVLSYAHSIRDGHWEKEPENLLETGEEYDVVIVGAGMAGLGAALEVLDSHPDKRVMILDNHSAFGGQSKENEFLVNGVRLMGPQGANGFHVPPPYSDDSNAGGEQIQAFVGDSFYYDRLRVPRQFSYTPLAGTEKPIRFSNDNTQFTYNWHDWFDVAHQFDDRMTGVKKGAAKSIELNSWQNGFASAPLEDDARRELLDVVTTKRKPYTGEDLDQWLDSMTYQHYLEQELCYSPVVTDYFSPIGFGINADGMSALAAYKAGLPGFNGYTDFAVTLKDLVRHSFPGGNGGFARYFIKELIPQAIAGDKNFDDIISGRINYTALDQPQNRIRMRLSATVTRVEHLGTPEQAQGVSIIYGLEGKAYRIKAKTVVMAGGGWINKHVVSDIGPQWKAAYDSFKHSSYMVANVAVNNWRFMEKMGVSGIRYPYSKDGFGYALNIRAPMQTASLKQPLDPNKPAVITFYAPQTHTEDGSPAQQCVHARMRMLTTSFAEHEKKIRWQMTDLFQDYGFDADRDIEGIILNRWGHSQVVPEPGFYTGKNGQPPAADIIRKRFGRIAFAHSELKGNQHYGSAAAEGRRAIRQLSGLFS